MQATTSYYVRVYNLIGLTGITLMFFRQFMRTRLSIRASRKLHDTLLDSVMAAPMSFFHTTPQGRVLNRFSNDVGTIDESLFESLCDVFRQVRKHLSKQPFSCGPRFFLRFL
jgi:ABC-type multidrug transport system fused ATPase/permease subunit